MTTTTPTTNGVTRPSADVHFRLNGAICVQRGTPMLQAFATGDLVVRQSAVDVYDPETDEGYQRSPVSSRMKSAATYYGEKGGRMPNPLLFNVREEDFGRVRVAITSGDTEGYERAIAEGGDWIGAGYIEFDNELEFWVYDGQHRGGGLEIVVAKDASFEQFPVPVSVTLGLDTTAEMKEFFEVNTNAKSVKTDLAWQLLTRMAEDDPDLQELLASKDQDWITRGIEVSRALGQLDGPWVGRVQAPNQKKAKGDDLTIPQAQLVRSLKPVLDMPVLKRADTAAVASVVNAYWKGIATVLPEPFEGKPNDYVIQKGQGAVAFHRVLPQVIEVVRAGGGRLGDPDAYADVLKELPTLSGEFVEQDGTVEARSGEEFWRVGSVASGFSGDSGRRRLGILIQTLIPRPSDVITI